VYVTMRIKITIKLAVPADTQFISHIYFLPDDEISTSATHNNIYSRRTLEPDDGQVGRNMSFH